MSNNSWTDFQSSVAKELKKRPFLKWKNKKTLLLCKKLFKKGYSVTQVISFIILN